MSDQLALDGAPWAGAGGARLAPSRRGYTAVWAQISREHLARNPTCQVCRSPASVSHHAYPLWRGGPVLTADGCLVPLCAPCHTHVERSLRAGWVAYCSAASALHVADRFDWDEEPAGPFPWETT